MNPISEIAWAQMTESAVRFQTAFLKNTGREPNENDFKSLMPFYSQFFREDVKDFERLRNE